MARRATAEGAGRLTVDLIERVVLDTTEAVAAARAKHRLYGGSKFYTPDFSVDWHSGRRTAVEVKLEGYVGGLEYEAKLAAARPILASHGYYFSKVIVPGGTEHPLRTNVNLLTKAARRPDLALCVDQVRNIEAVIGEGSIVLASFCARFAISPNVVPILLFTGVLSANLGEQMIDSDLQMTLAHGALDHLELLEGISK